jgi:L-methionine (R)-S-oxide reductase
VNLISCRRHLAHTLRMGKSSLQQEVLGRLRAALAGEEDLIAAMATAACELYHAFDHFDWVGFYRAIDDNTLKIGPYQGTHGCTTIRFDQGVCGACARTQQTQLVNDVALAPHHIACSNTTQAELVVPLLNAQGAVIAVLDVDSNQLNAFDESDVRFLEAVAVLCTDHVYLSRHCIGEHV